MKLVIEFKDFFCFVCESAFTKNDPHSSTVGGGNAAHSCFADRQVYSRRREEFFFTGDSPVLIMKANSTGI